MQPRPSFDRTLLIPIAIGVVSILGIGWILLTSDLGESLLPPTAIPFHSTTSTRDETPPTATGTSPDAYPGPPAETLPATSTLMTESLPTPSATPTPDQIQPLPSTSTLITESLPTPSATHTPDGFQPLPAGKYDDTNPNIDYGLYWTALKNPGTANAYKGTLHASFATGNQATFRFTGEQVRLGYQRGRNFGTVTVIIDGQPYSFHEQAFDLVWHSPQLSPGDHVVRIIHDSGESINLDYIEILD